MSIVPAKTSPGKNDDRSLRRMLHIRFSWLSFRSILAVSFSRENRITDRYYVHAVFWPRHSSFEDDGRIDSLQEEKPLAEERMAKGRELSILLFLRTFRFLSSFELPVRGDRSVVSREQIRHEGKRSLNIFRYFLYSLKSRDRIHFKKLWPAGFSPNEMSSRLFFPQINFIQVDRVLSYRS